MDLSKYDDIGDAAPDELAVRYRELQARLHRLCAEPIKDMVAIDAAIVELDEMHAGFKRSHHRDTDPQRF